MAESVKVAVRVRPFNQREKDFKSTLIIGMDGNQTTISDPNLPDKEPRKFAFDYSYWSHDGFNTEEDGTLSPTNAKYADQKRVFDDLGLGVLDNAWKGFNCSLFAYGQTGSGKSYSMVGFKPNKGIIPIACEQLFAQITTKRAADIDSKCDYSVQISMLEIYNEVVKDLLNPKSFTKMGLKVRQDKNKGFFCEGLAKKNVETYKEIEAFIDEGTHNRTVAATNMNETSSRAHTIVSIMFQQKSPNDAGQMMTKSSIIALVDLAGSERADSTGATGERLKEGSAINQSLSVLGNCIKALADVAENKKRIMVPFRDSKLTMLLKNALGGNSKTIMIAALSPAGINHDETLSTLRFADRAKAIKTIAVVNESPTEKLIRELKEEISRLKQSAGSGTIAAPISDEDKLAMEAQLKSNEEDMIKMRQSYEERLKAATDENAIKLQKLKDDEERKKTIPYLWNLNEDPYLSGMLTHFVPPGASHVGSGKKCEIIIKGVAVKEQHVLLTNTNNSHVLLKETGGDVVVNGVDIENEIELEHGDRIVFGSNHMYVLYHPQDASRKINAGTLTETEINAKPSFASVQEEIAEKRGFSMKGKSNSDLLLQEDLLRIMPMVSGANSMARELSKDVTHEIVLVSPQMRGRTDGLTEIFVHSVSDSGNSFYATKDDFMNRKFIMQEMHQDFIEGEPDWDKPYPQDPFYNSSDPCTILGFANIYIASLGYLLETEEIVPVQDFKANDVGHLDVKMYPCDTAGNIITDQFIENPKDLIGKDLSVVLKIDGAKGLPGRIAESYAQYNFFGQPLQKTSQEKGINPNYNDSTVVHIGVVDKVMLKKIEEDPLCVEIYARCKDVNKKAQRTETTILHQPSQPESSHQSIEESEDLNKKLEQIIKLINEAKIAGSKKIKRKKLEAILDDKKDESDSSDSDSSVDENVKSETKEETKSLSKSSMKSSTKSSISSVPSKKESVKSLSVSKTVDEQVQSATTLSPVPSVPTKSTSKSKACFIL